MIAISIRQPWAALIALLLKNVENRTWRMPEKHVGKLVLIHAGKALSPGWPKNWFDGHWVDEAEARGVAREAAREAMKRARPMWKATEAAALAYVNQQARGGIIGAVKFGMPVRDSSSPWAEPDSWHWPIEAAWPLPFHPCLGSLGFFDVPDYPHDTARPSWFKEAAC